MKGVGVVEYLLISLDLAVICYLQFITYSTFSGNLNRKSVELKSPMQQLLISNFSWMQDGNSIQFPL